MSEDTLPAAVSSRSLLRGASAGVLATHSVSVPGYPLGSVVPFVLMPDGRCVVHVSRIAEHTKNFEEDPRVSLTATEADLSGAAGDPQALGRVSVLGDASLLADAELDAARTRYTTFFPDAEGHAEVHAFDFWQIEPVRVRYIGGFGAIHWVEADTFCLPRMEWQYDEIGIVKHMNEDHGDAMALIWQHHEGSRPTDEDAGVPTMLASDPEGFHMRWEERIAYVCYAKLCETALDVRKEMVRLTKEARAAST